MFENQEDWTISIKTSYR